MVHDIKLAHPFYFYFLTCKFFCPFLMIWLWVKMSSLLELTTSFSDGLLSMCPRWACHKGDTWKISESENMSSKDLGGIPRDTTSWTWSWKPCTSFQWLRAALLDYGIVVVWELWLGCTLQVHSLHGPEILLNQSILEGAGMMLCKQPEFFSHCSRPFGDGMR